jgi:threonine/homoserine/homoserine lactone efflux protein
MVEMTWHDYLLKGAIIGFAISAPIGPIGVLCIRRTLYHGRISGLVSGLGATFADTFYGMVAAFGLTFIADGLTANLFWIRLFSGLFLLYLGIKTFFSPHQPVPKSIGKNNHFSDFASTFILTITNPLTIFGFAAIFASIGLTHNKGDFVHPLIIVVGVFLGSAFWWVIVSEGITFFRKKITDKVLIWANRIAGIIITFFGISIFTGLI